MLLMVSVSEYLYNSTRYNRQVNSLWKIHFRSINLLLQSRKSIRCRTFMSSLKLIYLAVSLGGLHTTISVPVYLSHAFLTEAERQSTGITENLVRISVGLENPQDLMNDLDQALKKATSVTK